MKTALLFFLLLGSLYACGTVKYAPTEYLISEGRIPAFTLKGRVSVSSIQDDTQQKVFFDGNSRYVGDLSSVSQHFAYQIRSEIVKNAQIQQSNQEKTVQVKVTRLQANSKFLRFDSSMDATAILGNGKTITLSVSQTSPAGMQRVLNGTIALGVIELLKNQDMINYLSE